MNQGPFCVEDKVVVITGGLGQLGRQYTQGLASMGAKVAVFDMQAGAESEGERSAGVDDSGRLLLCRVDVTQRESIESGLALVNEVWGVPHGLINNAAIDSPPDASAAENGPFEAYPEASWDQVMDVNVKGTFLCCQVIGAQMASAGRGAIVNIGSVYGMVSPDQRIYEYRRSDEDQFFKPVAYSASKSALINLTRYLATYWAHRNVRVNMLTLGGVFNDQDGRFLEEYCNRVPLGRMAREDEYNGAIIFLVSDASSYMTGSNLLIDGGWTSW